MRAGAATFAAVLLGLLLSACGGSAARSQHGQRGAGNGPGTVLSTRRVRIVVAGHRESLTALQVRYRTSGEQGQPQVTVTTIVSAPGQTGPPRLLSYQAAYDCDTASGRPSRQLTGAEPANPNMTLEAGTISGFLGLGYTLVISDYEGPRDEWGAGPEAGYGTLDGIRAAEHVLGLPASTPVGLVGYSGGATATIWAVQEQPTYAPELTLSGAAAGGVLVDDAQVLRYVDGTPNALIVPTLLAGLFRAAHVNVARYFTPTGRAQLTEAGRECLTPAFSGFRLSQALKPRYRDWEHVPAFTRLLNRQIMGRGATPREPLLIAAADADGIGDGLTLVGDMRELAHEFCRRGVPVTLQIYPKLTHDEGYVAFYQHAPAFLAAILEGHTPNGCASIRAGTSLAPLRAGG